MAVHRALFALAQDSVERSGKFALVRANRRVEPPSARGRERDPRGTAIIGIRLASDQSGLLDAIDELARPTDGDAERFRQVTDPETAIARTRDEPQRLEERQGQIVLLLQAGVDTPPEHNLQPDEIAQPPHATVAVFTSVDIDSKEYTSPASVSPPVRA